jgi:hypothetical protein
MKIYSIVIVILVIFISCTDVDEYKTILHDKEFEKITQDTLLLVDDKGNSLIAPIYLKASDNYVGVLDGILKHVFVYDLYNKELIYTTNKSIGKGPGEYQGVNAFGFKNDSLVVYDNKLKRATFIDLKNGNMDYYDVGRDVLNRTKFLGFMPQKGVVYSGFESKYYPSRMHDSKIFHSLRSKFPSFGKLPKEMSEYENPDIRLTLDTSEKFITMIYDQIGVIDVLDINSNHVAKINLPEYTKAKKIPFAEYVSSKKVMSEYFRTKTNIDGFALDGNNIYISTSAPTKELYFFVINLNDLTINRYERGDDVILDVYDGIYYSLHNVMNNPFIEMGLIR